MVKVSPRVWKEIFSSGRDFKYWFSLKYALTWTELVGVITQEQKKLRRWCFDCDLFKCWKFFPQSLVFLQLIDQVLLKSTKEHRNIKRGVYYFYILYIILFILFYKSFSRRTTAFSVIFSFWVYFLAFQKIWIKHTLLQEINEAWN